MNTKYWNTEVDSVSRITGLLLLYTYHVGIGFASKRFKSKLISVDVHYEHFYSIKMTKKEQTKTRLHSYIFRVFIAL